VRDPTVDAFTLSHREPESSVWKFGEVDDWNDPGAPDCGVGVVSNRACAELHGGVNPFRAARASAALRESMRGESSRSWKQYSDAANIVPSSTKHRKHE
jgi:hypothetical protein